jgi:isoquinoline 1-oxidoreductase beta subunit
MRRSLQAGTDPRWNRRAFLKVSAAATGGLLVSLYLDRSALAQEANAAPTPKVYPPDAFVHIRPDGTIVIQVNRLEFGQGIHTALPMILADEMDADWSRVVAELAPAEAVYADPVFGIQMVGQSSSITDSFTQYRELGARTRTMLVAAAAARWKIPEGECRTESGVVHGPDGRSATYAELAEAAARIPIPEKIRLKSPGTFRLVGTRIRRLDSRPKCDGSLKFGLDLDVPRMKVAVVAHPPVFSARVRNFDDAASRAVEGVRDVFEIPLARGTGVAVVADRFWPAKQGRDRLHIEWDLAGVERPDSAQLFAAYRDLARTTGNVGVARGEANAMDAIAEAHRIVAEYEFPFLAHTPMEPLNTTIRFDGDRAEVWAGSQFQTSDQLAIAEVLGLKPAQVVFHTEMTGG